MPMTTTLEPSGAGDGAAPALDHSRWLGLVVLLSAAFMDLLDTTIVNVALPSIRRDLGASYASVQWIAAAYVLAFGLGLIPGGRLGDHYGRKRMFVLGIALFTITSALCGLAPNAGVLIASRVAQGLAAALMVPQIMATVLATFPVAERAKATGLYGAVVGLAAVSGPIVSGLLVQHDLFGLGWRTIFLVNVPLGLVALVAAAALVRDSRSAHPLRADVPGLLLVTLGLLLLLYPLVQGRELGWPAWTFVSMAASPLALAAYAYYARAREGRTGDDPLLPTRLFRYHGFAPGLLVIGVFFAGMSAFFLVFTLVMQVGEGFSALRTGLVGIPIPVGSGIMVGLASAQAATFGRRLIVIGALTKAAGVAGLLWTLSTVPDPNWWQTAPSLFVFGLGMGLVIGPVFTVASAQVEGRDAGAAAGVLAAVGQLGGAVGIALLSVLFFNGLGASAGAAADQAAPQLRAALSQAGVPAATQQSIVDGFRACFVARATADDPEVAPPACRPTETTEPTEPTEATGAPRTDGVAAAVARATADAQRATFVRSLRTAGYGVLGGLLLVAAIAPLLPRRARPDHELLSEV
jgi:EmrB/QacA subfamily drug resistance transporter